MARTEEFMKRQEARIINFIITADKPLRNMKQISERLNIDYAYVSKLLQEMFNKGWVKTHIYDRVMYFGVTLRTPIKEAKERLMERQSELKHDTRQT